MTTVSAQPMKSEPNEREEYLKWFDENYPLYGKFKARDRESGWEGWQAKAQHQQKRIDELQEDLLDLRQQVNYRCADVQSLQAQLNIAVDALEFYRKSTVYSVAINALNTINKMKGE